MLYLGINLMDLSRNLTSQSLSVEEIREPKPGYPKSSTQPIAALHLSPTHVRI